MQTKNLFLILDFNAPNVNWSDKTTSYHDATFVWITRSVPGQRQTYLDLVFTKTIDYLLTGATTGKQRPFIAMH